MSRATSHNLGHKIGLCLQEEEHKIEGLPKDGYCRSKANLSAKVKRFS